MTVYFIQAGENGPIKIGFTHGSAIDRVRDMQTGNAAVLKVLATCEGDVSIERKFHKQFADSKIRGEWYHPVASLIQLIESVGFVGEGPKISLFKEETDASKLINKLGRDAVLSKLGISTAALSNALSRGVLPASWFIPLYNLGQSQHVFVGTSLFSWKAVA